MKTQATHTPGPFPLKMDIANTWGLYVIVTNQGNHYATTYDPSAARLISAAPELLTALKAMTSDDGFRRHDLEAARAAIAKAEAVNLT